MNDTTFRSGYGSLAALIESLKNTNVHTSLKMQLNKIIKIAAIPTPLGEMIAGSTDQGICLFEYLDKKILATQLVHIGKIFGSEMVIGSNQYIDQLSEEIRGYFDGKRNKFTLPLDIKGSAFQEKAWNILLKIPYGKTLSYKEQAEKIGEPKAVRAVANANGSNHLSIIIPCHRVIGSSGKLTGYGGGLWRKKYLLNLEGGNFL